MIYVKNSYAQDKFSLFID
jgi:hypothetical protein